MTATHAEAVPSTTDDGIRQELDLLFPLTLQYASGRGEIRERLEKILETFLQAPKSMRNYSQYNPKYYEKNF